MSPQQHKKPAANVVTVFNQKELTVSDFRRIIQSYNEKKRCLGYLKESTT